MNKLTIVLDKLEKLYNPVSIFIYGSRARKDFLPKSDYEIGILMRKKNYVRRSEIKKAINIKGFSIYPFEYERFIKYQIDTPFQKSIYLRDLVKGGKTLRGQKIIENMKVPPIKVIDILQDLRFTLGFAFASMHSWRNGDKYISSYEFYKSCFYGLRCLEILKLRKFAIGYEEIFKLSKQIKLGEYKTLVLNAYKIRYGKVNLQENDIFQNISFLNKFIESQVMEYFEKKGNKILIK